MLPCPIFIRFVQHWQRCPLCLLCRNVWKWGPGRAHRLQQRDLCGRCRSKALYTGQYPDQCRLGALTLQKDISIIRPAEINNETHHHVCLSLDVHWMPEGRRPCLLIKLQRYGWSCDSYVSWKWPVCTNMYLYIYKWNDNNCSIFTLIYISRPVTRYKNASRHVGLTMFVSVNSSTFNVLKCFVVHRERAEDPHFQRSDELHEPSAHFRHSPRRGGLHSTTEGSYRLNKHNTS